MTYLSKDGKSTGPYTDEQIRAMQDSGDLLKYQWMWPTGAANWQPIAPPPPPAPPVMEASQPAEVRAQAPSREPSQPKVVRTFERAIEAVALDQREVVSGNLDRITEEGCDLVSEDRHGPVFGQQSRLVLSLLDSASGRTVTVRARLVHAKRQEKGWAYRLEWDECPALLAN